MLSNWSGYIAGDTVWDDTSEPYVIDGHLTVNPNASLTIAPGVEVSTQGYGYSGDGYELNVYGTLNAQEATFINRTELFARAGSQVDLDTCDISSNWIQYDNGSSGSMENSVLHTGYLTLSAPGVSIDGNEFTGTDPVHTTPALVEELTDNTFSSSDTATIYLGGEVGGDATLSVIGAASRYSLENHVTVTEGATLTVAPGVEVHTQGYGHSGAGYEMNIHGAFIAGGATFTNRTELFARAGSQVDLDTCDISSNWIQYDNGSSGSMENSVLRTGYLTLSAPGVSIDGNEFTGTDPVHTTPALVQELTDNTFSSSDTATIYLGGEVGGDATLSVIGA
ncbi:MAG: hypothetical protein ACQESR_26135, partial [Planctomycetota bacterium]